MKFFIKGPFQENVRVIMRRSGYSEKINPKNGVVSYIHIFGRLEYPRFHVYIDEQDETYCLNIHMDQKSVCYSGQTAHSGEYEGENVRNEAERIHLMFTHSKKVDL